MDTMLGGIDLTDLDTFVHAVPHDQFDRLRSERPVYFHPQADGPGFWCLTRMDDVRELSHDWKTFSNEYGFTLMDEKNASNAGAFDGEVSMLLGMDPPRHTRLRLLVNRGFTPRMVERLHERIRELARTIVDDVAARGECDFVVDVAVELPLQVIVELMGVPTEDRAQISEWSNQLSGSDDPEYNVTSEQFLDAGVAMFAYANELAAKKRANPSDDIVSVLLQAEIDGEKLTDVEFDIFFELLAIAGNETTRNLISHGMLALMEHPDQREILLADPTRLPTAVDEMLRYASPVMHMRRTAMSDVSLRGETIRAGQSVVFWYPAANRDPDAFADPHRFDVTRTPNDHVAFGAGGPHFCLGAHLARLEATVMFEELFARIPRMELAGPVDRLRSNMINGIKHMPVRFAPS